jgi:predicted MFS family arabinose efflux permease
MRGSGGWSLRFMIPKLVSYLLFGAGYIAYMPFVIAYLHGEGFSDGFVSVFWAALGLSTVAGAFAWGPLLGRLKGGWGATVTIGVVTLGAGLPLVCRGVAGAIVSAILFGGSFLAVVAAVTAFARRAARPHAWTAAIGALTVAFGLGQCIGPVLSGALSDGPAGVRAGLLLSVAILATGAVVAIFQREPERAA